MNPRLKALQEQGLEEERQRQAMEELQFQHYLSRRQELFDLLVDEYTKYCTFRKRITLKCVLNSLDLDSFPLLYEKVWLFQKWLYDEADERIKEDFQKFCRENGVEFHSYWFSSHYGGSGF